MSPSSLPSDRFYPLDAEFIIRALLLAYKDPEHFAFFGVPGVGRFMPQKTDPFRTERYGKTLETPLGLAAGPHTQLAQNIISGYLTGARYFELKTVQENDTLSLTKPCIHARHEGFNVEFSQELTLKQSLAEYQKAYIFLHIIQQMIGHEACENGPGFLFNMSAGYTLDGIKSPTMTAFFQGMANATDTIHTYRENLSRYYPPLATMAIDPCVSDSVTLSTMHGCPPEEIGRIARYFMEDLGLHTTIKLNPTLLGAQNVRTILGNLGYTHTIPDSAFEHDMQFDDAVALIRELQTVSQKTGKEFHVKLSNTLQVLNNGLFAPEETSMYMSGRPLYPVAMALASRIQQEFNGSLDISYCGGLDAYNSAQALAAGLAPLTYCTDLLRPGGYTRLLSSLDAIQTAMQNSQTTSLAEFAPQQTRLQRLQEEAAQAAKPGNRYNQKNFIKTRSIKRVLPVFDCAVAPCHYICPTMQNQPEYLDFFSHNNDHNARKSLLASNALHHTQAEFCDNICRHSCEKACSRSLMERPVNIHDIRFFVQSIPPIYPFHYPHTEVWVAGAGFSGLMTAAMLFFAGLRVILLETDWEARKAAAGPLGAAMQKDMDALTHQGMLVTDDLSLVQQAKPYAHIFLSAEAPEGIQQYLERSPDACIYGNTPSAGPASFANSLFEAQMVVAGILTNSNIPLRDYSMPTRDPIKTLYKRLKTRPDARETAEPIRSLADARKESTRCLGCDLACANCVQVCPNRALIPMPRLAVPVPLYRVFPDAHPQQEGQMECHEAVQIIRMGDVCNECGNCAQVCPSSGLPYKDKASVYFQSESFSSADKGFFFTKAACMAYKDGEYTAMLSKAKGSDLIYVADENISAAFESSTLALVSCTVHNTREDSILLEKAALMLMVYGLTRPLQEILLGRE